MNLPPTFEEVRTLCERVTKGEALPADVLAMLDGDYFAACDVTDLDPRHVDTIVRWALREYVRKALYWSVQHGAQIENDQERRRFDARVQHGPIDPTRRKAQDAIVDKAMQSIIAALREANGIADDQGRRT